MRNIYVVDDDDPVRLSLQSLLSIQNNLVIRGFRSGDAFLADLPELEPGVLLLDYNMPGTSGLETLRTVSAEPRRFAAIMLTGEGNVSLAVDAMKFGAVDFLEKPYEPAKLLDVVASGFARLEQDNDAASRAEMAKAKIAALTPRQKDVLKGLIEGRANKVIAHDLDISPRTVEIYRASLMEKLEVRSLSEALRIAFAAGMFPPE
jgi:two-component system response regulator FixJ